MGVAAKLLSKGQAAKHAQMAALNSAHKDRFSLHIKKIVEIGILLVYVVYHYDWVPTILSL